MEPALVLSEDLADAAGIAVEGPITFGGAFPGVFTIGVPVAITELGFASAGEATAAVDAADVPLELVTVAAGDGRVERDNHGLSASQAREAQVDDAIDAAGTIRSHADADAVADALGIAWPAERRLTVAEKVAAIDAVRAGASPADAVAPPAEDVIDADGQG